MVQNPESEFSVAELYEVLSPEQLQNLRLQKMSMTQAQQVSQVPLVAAPSSSDIVPTSVGQVAINTPRGATIDSSSLICPTCSTVNVIPTNDTHYTITVGKSVGVFSDLAFVQSQVMGVSGACFKRYSSQAAALQAYQLAAAQGVVRIVNA